MNGSRSLRNDRIISTLLLILCITGFWLFENYLPIKRAPSEPAETSLPLLPEFMLPGKTRGTLVKHQYYWLSYQETYEQAEWVAYVLLDDHLTNHRRKRPLFREDPLLSSSSAAWSSYKDSGYDRGHLCPAGDRRFSGPAYEETFFTSNIAPQHKRFNAGIWNRLEIQVREWCRSYGEVYVVTGGVLQDGLPVIGAEDIAVPEMFYKIVARGKRTDLRILAFLVPHKESNRPLEDYRVSVDEVEKATGIDFFKSLPVEQQKILESSTTEGDWNF
jgi:endonuclease G, mitochondrial